MDPKRPIHKICGLLVEQRTTARALTGIATPALKAGALPLGVLHHRDAIV